MPSQGKCKTHFCTNPSSNARGRNVDLYVKLAPDMSNSTTISPRLSKHTDLPADMAAIVRITVSQSNKSSEVILIKIKRHLHRNVQHTRKGRDLKMNAQRLVHVPHARKDQRLRWDNQGIRNRVIR
jgi:hypothetical protein